MLLVLFSLISLIVTTLECNNCGKNEEYRCDYQCQKTCRTRDVLFKCVSEKICQCFCTDGHVRDDNKGNCIPISECPTCRVNETYKDSGIDCQTCENYQYVKCALRHESKCYCLDGYVTDEETGFCLIFVHLFLKYSEVKKHGASPCFERVAKKKFKKTQDVYKRREENFQNNSDNLFDIAHNNALEWMKLEEDNNALEWMKLEEDRIFLQKQRELGRPGCLAGVDKSRPRKKDMSKCVPKVYRHL
ncbi:hypothetical protein QE152_g39180 [Popillia japonica]|uniref:Uncharacterized protein n=1 Tax=Popillia japonica TaxID=7064 RepID=A0AAW1HV94_POPJA